MCSLEENAVPVYERLTMSYQNDIHSLSVCMHIILPLALHTDTYIQTHVCFCVACICVNYIGWLNILCFFPCGSCKPMTWNSYRIVVKGQTQSAWIHDPCLPLIKFVTLWKLFNLSDSQFVYKNGDKSSTYFTELCEL